MHSDRRKLTWSVFVIFSALLLIAYIAGDLLSNHVVTDLKGLTLLEHFSIHYVTGMFFGLIILIGFRFITQRCLNEPLVLSLSVLWSHWPDIRYAYRQLPHSSWEIIFFFHTVVDEMFMLFWPIMITDALLTMLYLRLTSRT